MWLGIEPSALTAFAAVILIDVALSGDNAIVIGLAVAGLPEKKRGRIIVIGIIGATVMRLTMAAVAVPLLSIIGLLLAGGLLLLWVAWKMWRELRAQASRPDGAPSAEGSGTGRPASKKPAQAVLQIMLADLSMSLDNVLAVAGAARDHPWVMMMGLGLSILLMAIASGYIARLLNRHRWLAYLGLAIVAYVAVDMIWHGAEQVLAAGRS